MNNRLRLESPYDSQGKLWLRGNLHAHTVRSDGSESPQGLVDAYAKRGYDFLSLSDHDVVSDFSGLDSHGMILLMGNEVSGRSAHMLDIGARELIACNGDHQQLLDAINARSGFPVLCHPNWEELFDHYPYAVLAALKNYQGIEIFNGLVIDLEGSHLAADKWDRLLSAGRVVWGFANDDAHRPVHIGRGWNMVLVPERTAPAILKALRQGSFYASSGVTIEQIACDGSRVQIRAANADRIAVFGAFQTRLHVVDGSALDFDAATVASPYIRVECYGRGGQCAWTQPFFIRGGQFDRVQEFQKQMEARERSSMKASPVGRAPVMSGKVDDPLWQQAAVFDQFMEISTGQPAPVRTELRCLLAAGSLYFGLRCHEPLLQQIPEASSGSGIWNADSVEVFLDVEGTGAGCYQMIINASRGVSTICHGDRPTTVPHLRGAVGRWDDGQSRGWSAELAVPVAELQAPSGPPTRWGLHVCRNRFPVRGTYVWSWVGHSNHNRTKYGSLFL